MIITFIHVNKSNHVYKHQRESYQLNDIGRKNITTFNDIAGPSNSNAETAKN